MFKRASLLAIGEFVVLMAVTLFFISIGKPLSAAAMWIGVLINDAFAFWAFKPLMSRKNKEK
jgi:hypothetical protein